MLSTPYAHAIRPPILLLYGEKDEKVSAKEIQGIFRNLKGYKKLATYPMAGHENYLIRYNEKWKNDINAFLEEHK